MGPILLMHRSFLRIALHIWFFKFLHLPTKWSHFQRYLWKWCCQWILHQWCCYLRRKNYHRCYFRCCNSWKWNFFPYGLIRWNLGNGLAKNFCWKWNSSFHLSILIRFIPWIILCVLLIKWFWIYWFRNDFRRCW